MTNLLFEPKFNVRNLGGIQFGEFVHKPLTIFCGENNTGKTWTLYALYSFHRLLSAMQLSQEEDCVKHIETLNELVSENLPRLFNTSSLHTAEATFHIDEEWRYSPVNKTEIASNVFLMPAERTGLNLIFRELSRRRTSLLHRVSREDADIQTLLRDVRRSRYAEPIADYIDWLNDLPEIQEASLTDFRPYAREVAGKLAGGVYGVSSRSGTVSFRPSKGWYHEASPRLVGLHTASSSVKSLFALWFYLQHQASAGDILLIDEPELNLHPLNQVSVARLLVKLVNTGIDVVISTHSDYIVREINSMVMLSQKGGESLREKHGYDEDETLAHDKVGAYLFREGTIEPFELTPDDGIHATTFDEVIQKMNDVNDDIFYSLQEFKDEDHDDRTD